MKRPLCFICILYCILVGVLIQNTEYANNHVSYMEGDVVEVSGEVIFKKYVNDKWQIRIWDKEKSQGILCYLKDNNPPLLGSYVDVKGTYFPFQEATNLGQFDAKSYYKVLNLDYSIKQSKVINQSKEYNKRKEFFFQLSWNISGVYDVVCSEKDASLLKSMILGNKSVIDGEIKRLFERNGISHILAISGLHISFLGMGIYKLLKKLKMSSVCNICCSIFVVICYSELIEMSSSSYRAICMFFLMLFGKYIGRTYDMLSGLSFAAILILMEQPLYLTQGGFLLSFFAVLGITCVYPVLCEDTDSKDHKIQKSMEVSFSVFLMNLPIQAYFFYEVSLYSIVLNLVVVPLVGIILVSGILGGFIGLFSLEIAQICLFPAKIIFQLYEWMCQFMNRMPCQTIITGKPSVAKIVVYYVALFSCLFIYKIIKKKKWQNADQNLYILIIACVGLVFYMITPTKHNRVTFLDVSQGDGCVIQTKEGITIVIDGGSSDVMEGGKYRLIPFLKASGISKVDYAFVSHPDMDHDNMILECVENQKGYGITIETVVMTEYATAYFEEYEEIVNTCKKGETKVATLKTGDKLGLKQLHIICVYPDVKNGLVSDVNEQSMVLYIEFRKQGFLFTGDIGVETEKDVVRELEQLGINKIDFLKVAHHGSKYSSSDLFLQTIRPTYAIVSSSKKNTYGHPHEETLQRLRDANAIIYLTKEQGGIAINLD